MLHCLCEILKSFGSVGLGGGDPTSSWVFTADSDTESAALTEPVPHWKRSQETGEPGRQELALEGG